MAINAAYNTLVAEQAIASDSNMLVPWYLIASYAYYIRDEYIITDSYYDTICFLLMEELDAVNIDHRHAHLCDMKALSAGTGHHISESQYPLIIVSVAEGFISGENP